MGWLWNTILKPLFEVGVQALGTVMRWIWDHPTASLAVGSGLYALSWLVSEYTSAQWLSELLSRAGSIVFTAAVTSLAFGWIGELTAPVRAQVQGRLPEAVGGQNIGKAGFGIWMPPMVLPGM